MTREQKINNFIAWLNERFGKEYNFKIEGGKKYFKISHTIGTQKTVYCFVDIEGNIYLPASWKAPAKPARGHIDNPELCCDRYGIKYKNNKGELI